MWIPDFDPGCLIWNVWIKFSFSDNALKVFLAGKSEQALSILIDMVAVDNPFAFARENRSKAMLPFSQGSVSQVLPVDVQEIEDHESRFTTAEHQVFELRRALLVEADNFPVKNCGLNT